MWSCSSKLRGSSSRFWSSFLLLPNIWKTMLMPIPDNWTERFLLLRQWKMEMPTHPFDITTEYGFLELYRRVDSDISIVDVSWDQRIRILHTHLWQAMLLLNGPPPRLEISTREEASEFNANTARILAALNQSATWWNLGDIGGILKAMILQHSLYCRDTIWRHGIRIETTILTLGSIPEGVRHFVNGRHPFLWDQLQQKSPDVLLKQTWFQDDPAQDDFLQAALAAQYGEELTGTVITVGDWANGDPRAIRWYLECVCDVWTCYLHECYINRVEPPFEIIQLLNSFLAQMDSLLRLMTEVVLIPIPAEYLPLDKIPEDLVLRRCRALTGLYRRPAMTDTNSAEPLMDVAEWQNKFTKDRDWVSNNSEDSGVLRTVAARVRWPVLILQQAMFFATFNEDALGSAPNELRQAAVQLLDLLQSTINSIDAKVWRYMPNPRNIPHSWRHDPVRSAKNARAYIGQHTASINSVFNNVPEAIYGVRYGISLADLLGKMTLDEESRRRPRSPRSGRIESNQDTNAMDLDDPNESIGMDGSAHDAIPAENPKSEDRKDPHDQSRTTSIAMMKRGSGKLKRAKRIRKTVPPAVVIAAVRVEWKVMEDPRRDHYPFYSAGEFTGFALISLNRVHSDEILPPWHPEAGELGIHEIIPEVVLEIELTMVLAQKVGMLTVRLRTGAKPVSKRSKARYRLVHGYSTVGGVGAENAGHAISGLKLATIERHISEMTAVPPDHFCKPEEYVRLKDTPDKDEMFGAVGPRLGLEGRPPLAQAEKKTLAAKELPATATGGVRG
ncbi:hypothetical protein CALCODRAFT_513503 [Calocera cornea HHB12733]|uniref:Uncharacterized protein n=1 Tax=Calocera cornea HHB12733 TaxID=1353952 RepID=A0A165C1C2_9BASI|nr:hypothetical protein CALCODRAFT_513503 [Calocera cornea HHB12733]